ncbi:MAG: hypothetical protein EAZ27_05075 [Cytophagales bacterium]|nr:MAG: hypothetical protein EAZ27_05075 [Cytophagales bacterium]
MKKNKPISIILLLFNIICTAQQVPGKEENIPYLVTFSKDSEKRWGDDDFSQTWFYVIPKDTKKPFYIRVYDPDVAGKIDELKADANSKTKFSVFGGKGCYTDPDATNKDPLGNYKSGTLLNSKVFGNQPEFDEKWFNFGPFNPTEGELINELNGYVFKIISDGLEGNDGNLYKYFLSSSSISNIPLEGANLFTYEYTFRVDEKPGSISHVYPFVDENVISVNINTFDLDDDSYMRLVSVAKKGDKINGSIDNEWAISNHTISNEEKKTSLDIQIIKFREKVNNNLVLTITNQYGKSLPFFSIPIGGVPKYKYKIGIK